MSSIIEDHSSRLSVGDETGDVIKSGLSAKMNGLSEDSAGSACENDSGRSELKENGLANHAAKSSSHKHGDGHHHSSSKSSGSERDKHHSSSSAKHKDGVSSSSSKHSSSSSKHKENSSSKHRDGHSSSSSRHKEGSSSHHSSASSSSKHKEGSSSSSVHKEKDKSNSSSSKPKDGSESSSPDKHSSSKHKESSSSSSLKHKESHSSSSSKPKDGASSKDKTSSSSASTDRLKDSSKDKSSSSSDKYKDRNKESGRSSDKDKSKSSSTSASSKNREGEKHSSSNVDKQKSQAKTEGSYQGENSVSTSVKNKVTSQQSKVDVKVKIEAIEEDMEVSHTAATIKKEEPSSPVKNEKYSGSPVKQPPIKSEDESEDDDKPLSVRKKESKPVKRRKEESDYEEDESQDNEEDEDSDVPLSMRNKAKKLKLSKKPEKKAATTKSTPPKKKMAVKHKKEAEEKEEDEPVKKKKKEENEESVWKWWEEQRENSDIKWTFLEHKGPVFAPLYEPLPKNVRFYYDGKPMHLTPDTEEVAVFYGRMLDHDYTTRDVFNTNFMKDWRKVMSAEEKAKITDLKKCNFQEICDYFKKKTEERKAMSKEEKQRLRKENEELVKEYGYCIIDKHKEKIGNFKIEPPGLFRGRGDHPKQGMLKHRINPEDVIINCSKDSKIPVPPAGRKWKEVRHDNTVTWLASWTENIQGATKYIMLNAASKLKGEKDWQKYETARKLHKCVDRIRAQYQEDWKSKEMRIRQRAVALYFIDKLALRAGNEKEEGETADTVGCCSLRVEHIKLHTETDEGKQYVVEFDFLGKDSIRYQNAIPVEKRVFKNLQLFMENKQPEDDLFDRLNTTILNKHLQDLMEGLTAKVFRTFNASKTLSEQLELLTNPNDTPAAKMLSYNRANRAVAILCNHQRAVPKTFEKSMGNLMKKIDAKRDEIKEVKKEIKDIKADYKRMKSVKTKTLYEKKKKTLARLEDQLSKLDVMATDKDENKEIALSTSKLNYLDPRISVAWCKKFGVPIEKVYNKTQRDKFRWAIDMADAHFKF